MAALKIAFIGAGSGFCPSSMVDLFLDNELNRLSLDIRLMDIKEEHLSRSMKHATEAAARLGLKPRITGTTSLPEALEGADFVLAAIEVDRYPYWTMDFHIPRRFGSTQVYGENGGPGGMFHFLRNVGPMLEVARTMERVCPNALLITYTNPEAKLVDAISRLSMTTTVGLCHGIGEGQQFITDMLGIPESDLDVSACGLNHFGWYQKIRSKRTGEDLYPLLKQRERAAQWMAKWDGYALLRILLRTYGLLPYPVTNHVGEYIRWADGFIASPNMQFFHDPVSEEPWNMQPMPPLVYFAFGHTDVPLFRSGSEEDFISQRFEVNEKKLRPSGESGIPIIKAICMDKKTELLTVNMRNGGKIPGLQDDLAVELPATVDGKGIHPRQMDPLPDAVTEMIRLQGVIHKLLAEAYVEQSRNKLLQAMLLDPTTSSYHGAVSTINDMCERQKELLPPMRW
jgi:alpha-galactosidase